MRKIKTIKSNDTLQEPPIMLVGCTVSIQNDNDGSWIHGTGGEHDDAKYNGQS